MSSRILIAIPVYNEAAHVDRVLREVQSYHGDILVVDDGSTDGTADLLQQRHDIHLIRHRDNEGYGQSLIDAFAYADAHGYDWVITMDCDEQHEPRHIPAFIAAIEDDQADIVSGSRYLDEALSGDAAPTDRRRINMQLTELINQTLHLGLTDSFCGFKAHRVSAMRRLRLDETGYAFPMQLWPRVALEGLRVIEIPVRRIYNDPNRVFGGQLDDPDRRLRHYLGVFHRELAPLAARTGDTGDRLTDQSADPLADQLVDEQSVDVTESADSGCVGCGCDD